MDVYLYLSCSMYRIMIFSLYKSSNHARIILRIHEDYTHIYLTAESFNWGCLSMFNIVISFVRSIVDWIIGTADWTIGSLKSCYLGCWYLDVIHKPILKDVYVSKETTCSMQTHNNTESKEILPGVQLISLNYTERSWLSFSLSHRIFM